MKSRMARTCLAADRVFPPISRELYRPVSHASSLNADQRAALKLLEMGRNAVSPWRRILKRDRSSGEQVRFALSQHRMAMEAELCGRVGSADFFWGELYKSLVSLLKDDAVWENTGTYLNEPEAKSLHDTTQLRQRLVSEVLIDTHCAFHNGYLQQGEAPSLDNRAFVHLKHIRFLVDSSPPPRDEMRGLFSSSMGTWIDSLRDAGRWNECVELAYFRLKHFPESEEYQAQLARLQLAFARSSLGKDTSRNVARRDAITIAHTINALDLMRGDFPYNVTIYQVLGALNSIYATKLANAGNPAESVVAFHRALLLDPELEGSEETKDFLFEAIAKIQQRSESLKAQMNDSGAPLSAEGRRVVDEAQKGFSLMSDYAQSEEARSLADDSLTARARKIWRLAGLAEPQEQFDLRARRLGAALRDLFADPPANPGEVVFAWRQSASDPLLQDVDHSKVCSFLRKRLFEKEPAAGRPDQERFAPSENPPFLDVANKITKGEEPFSYWLFSKYDLRLKSEAALAILLLLLGGFLGSREVYNSGVRDEAFKQVLGAIDNTRYEDVIAGCETFLSHPGLATDLRQSRVLGFYEESLVRLVQQEREPKPGTLSHLETYRRLAGKPD